MAMFKDIHHLPIAHGFKAYFPVIRVPNSTMANSDFDILTFVPTWLMLVVARL
jgi:hypothetical protein